MEECISDWQSIGVCRVYNANKVIASLERGASNTRWHTWMPVEVKMLWYAK